MAGSDRGFAYGCSSVNNDHIALLNVAAPIILCEICECDLRCSVIMDYSIVDFTRTYVVITRICLLFTPAVLSICDLMTNLFQCCCRKVIWVIFYSAKQFDKSGLAISQCIFYGKSLHCSDLPLRTALWCQFWRDQGAAAPVLSAFLCRWRVSPTFFGTYVDAPL